MLHALPSTDHRPTRQRFPLLPLGVSRMVGLRASGPTLPMPRSGEDPGARVFRACVNMPVPFVQTCLPGEDP